MASTLKSVGLAIMSMTLGIAVASRGWAQGASSANNIETQSAGTYWTPERLRNAVPLDVHPSAVRPDGLPATAGQTAPIAGQRQRGNGALPTVKTWEGKQILEPSRTLKSALGVQPQANYSYGPFTTARDANPTAYPARTAGQLYFTDPRTGGNYVCSASVLRPRIIMTAGHCVTKPSTSARSRYFYSRFQFVPAYSNGYAPFGTWDWSQAWVTNVWYYSNGSVPNAADEAIIIAADRSGTKIGSVTGYLGWITYALSYNNLTQKGYPCNLDSWALMETNNASTYSSGGNNTYIFGSGMRGGSSGGPWVQDFGIAPVSNPGLALGGNYLAGVTSYGPVATNVAYIGLSQFDGNFTSLLSSACNASAGNCWSDLPAGVADTVPATPSRTGSTHAS